VDLLGQAEVQRHAGETRVVLKPEVERDQRILERRIGNADRIIRGLGERSLYGLVGESLRQQIRADELLQREAVSEGKGSFTIQVIRNGAAPAQAEIGLRARMLVQKSGAEARAIGSSGDARTALRKEPRDGTRRLLFLEAGENRGGRFASESQGVIERIENA